MRRSPFFSPYSAYYGPFQGPSPHDRSFFYPEDDEYAVGYYPRQYQPQRFQRSAHRAHPARPAAPSVITVPVHDPSTHVPFHGPPESPRSPRPSKGHTRIPSHRPSQTTYSETPALQSRKPRLIGEYDAATTIQAHFRGFCVRRHRPLVHLRSISSALKQLDELKAEIESPGFLQKVTTNEKERLRVNEAVMVVLLRLDAVEGCIPEVRSRRKEAIKRAVALQDFLDTTTAQKSMKTTESDCTEQVEKNVRVEEINETRGAFSCTGTNPSNVGIEAIDSHDGHSTCCSHDVGESINEDCNGLQAEVEESGSETQIDGGNSEDKAMIHIEEEKTTHTEGESMSSYSEDKVAAESSDAKDISHDNVMKGLTAPENLQCLATVAINEMDDMKAICECREHVWNREICSECESTSTAGAKELSFEGHSADMVVEVTPENNVTNSERENCVCVDEAGAVKDALVIARESDASQNSISSPIAEESRLSAIGESDPVEDAYGNEECDQPADNGVFSVDEKVNVHSSPAVLSNIPRRQTDGSSQALQGTNHRDCDVPECKVSSAITDQDGGQIHNEAANPCTTCSQDRELLQQLSEDCKQLKSMLNRLLLQSRAQSKVICALGSRLETLEQQQEQVFSNPQQCKGGRERRKPKKGSKK
ncbi:hypothetical protein KP509_23G030700 [Ceratopteris richardii]|uniref:BAG domain-containing protein n=1 Tax=Ceratopteris richardii TaxID=49495 RepID=A0A8T2RYC1_CERRI|nr:hypothetical protein KP509_23G030700 [Ceratopteris richardii]